MPDFPLVDSHVHFYDTERLSYPWLAGIPAIAGSHLPSDFDRARGAVAVGKIVFVEVDGAPQENLAEARFATGLASADQRIAGIIARAPLERGAAAAAELTALARLRLVCGIRRVLQAEADPEFCLRPDFLAGVRLLARYEWPFDVCVYHRQLGAVTELARRCPEVVFMLDHIGKPAIKAGESADWKRSIDALARLPNVFCKISGVITEADPVRWSEAAVRPWIEHVLARFGFARVMFGGDWPVLELAGTYERWVAVLDRILERTGADDLQRFYRDNAIRVYRLT